MHIAAAYANRTDLSSFDKRYLTIWGQVQENPASRAMYKALCRDAPAWLQVPLATVVLLCGIPLFLALVIGTSVSDNGEDERVGFSVFAGALVVELTLFATFSTYGWIATLATVFFISVFWWWMIMGEYGEELDRATERSKPA